MSKLVARIRPLLRPQINRYTCGPAALRNAMLVYGVRADIRRLARIAGTTEQWGTDYHQLARAAERLGCTLALERRRTPALAREALRSLTAIETPVLAAIDREVTPGAHWVTIVHTTSRVVTFCDSARNWRQVEQRATWREFMARWCAWYPATLPRGQAVTIFDFYPLRLIGTSIK